MFERLTIGIGIVLITFGFVGIVGVDSANTTLREDVVTTTIVWFCVAFIGYLGVMRILARRNQRVNWRWLLALGLVLRLLLLATTPTLSDDVYRYLWEGHLVTEGVSPYSFPIDSPLGDEFSIEARSLANNTSLASPYLPVAHGLFGSVAAVLPSKPWTMQLMMIGFDVMAVAMLFKLLRLAHLPERRVLLYWLNPLVIIEVAHGAHIDAVIVGLTLSGLVASLDKNRISPASQYLGPLLIAAATLTRPLPMLLMPVLFWVWNWKQRWTWLAAVALPIGVIGTAIGFGLGNSVEGVGVFGSARAYTDTFRFNSGIYHWLERWVSSQGLDDKGWNEPAMLTRLIIAVAVVGALSGVFLSARRDQNVRSILRLICITVMAYVLLTPVLHPWYTLLLLALVPFLSPGNDESPGRWAHVVPWIALSGLLMFSYLTYEDPTAFAEREWVRRLEWYPTLILFGVGLLWFVPAIRQRIVSQVPATVTEDGMMHT